MRKVAGFVQLNLHFEYLDCKLLATEQRLNRVYCSSDSVNKDENPLNLCGYYIHTLAENSLRNRYEGLFGYGRRRMWSQEHRTILSPSRLKETPGFSGLAMASLYSDPQLMSKTGSVVIAAEAALEYGYKDFNGRQPPSLREQKGSPRLFFTTS